MDEDEEMAEIRAQEAKRVRDEAKKCLRHASFQLGKAAYEIDEYLKDFSTARISKSHRRNFVENLGQRRGVRDERRVTAIQVMHYCGIARHK